MTDSERRAIEQVRVLWPHIGIIVERTARVRSSVRHESYNEHITAVVGEYDKVWNKNERTYTGPDEDLYLRIEGLAHALDNGAFDDMLLAKFGDHARVKVVAGDGIYVEFYDHH